MRRSAMTSLWASERVILALMICSLGCSMRTGRPWTEKDWCDSVENPEWPMAYQKYSTQSVESKGRVNSNLQDMRHECVTYGGESKCHICEDIEDGLIKYQLQGVAWEEMAHNIPTVTDSPFAVGGAHRFDFGNASTSHVCVILSGRNCIRPSLNSSFFPPPPPSHPMPNLNRPSDMVGRDYSNCTVRCWGYLPSLGFSGALDDPQSHLEANYYEQGTDIQDTYRQSDGDSSLATDVWEYPKYYDSGSIGAEDDSEAYGYPSSAYGNKASGASELTFNPQGFAYTLAGGGTFGYQDGYQGDAQFKAPQDLAVSADRNVYVADTGNHCIRKVSPTGTVTTVAGVCGTDGYHDGSGTSAKFSSPSGITAYYDWHSVSSASPSYGQLVLFVADTNNHRIRRVDCVDGGVDALGDACDVKVSCWAGTCGNGTFSWTATHKAAPPQPGLADGHGSVARFDSPRGLEAAADGTLYIADTNNHLIRVMNATQWVFTLAGHVVPQEQGGGSASTDAPLPGCPSPCVKGVSGFRDGNLTYAEFNYPADITLGYTQFNDSLTDDQRKTTTHGGSGGGNWSVLVVDSHRVRRITFPADYVQVFWGRQARFRDTSVYNLTTTYGHSNLNGIRSAGEVSTIAGQRTEGTKDGTGSEAEFSSPEGIAMDASGHIFTVDSGTCRLRRITYANQVAFPITCQTLATEVIRPSGCTSYDHAVDKRDLTVSPAFGNLYYNYGDRFQKNHLDGNEPRGRSVKNCVGTPPPDKLDKHFWNVTGENLVIDDGRVEVIEDTGDSTTIKVMCPTTCAADVGLDPIAGTNNYATSGYPTVAAGPALFGSGLYSDDSPICLAALHSGALKHHEEGMVVVTLRRGILDRNSSYATGSTRNGVTSYDLDVSDGDDPTGGSARLFSVEPYAKSLAEVQSVSGRPGALLQDSCGHSDGQPAQEALYKVPQGVSLFVNASLSQSEVLFIADTGNNRIRAVSAICSQICENGGICTGHDSCTCPSGWGGYDCTLPTCSSGCGENMLCVAPDTCACAPGYSGADCKEATCVQECQHGGVCSAPDTCSCPYGWWDANCSTPVCSQTCGNGANCTAPDKCSCPSDWTGVDCRVPVCENSCMNGGSCVAPGTCLCPPQWHGPTCSLPICTQGFFIQDPSPYLYSSSTSKPSFWRSYSPCNHEDWCNSTNGFDCRQRGRSSYAVEPLYGAKYRNVTGRVARPARCMRIEIGEDVISHFQYVNSSLDNGTAMYGFLSTSREAAAQREYLQKRVLSGYARYTPKQPFGWTGPDIMAVEGSSGENYLGGDGGASSSEKPDRRKHTRPWYFVVDRQVAAVELRNHTRGVYVCANGGNCSAPDTCRCAEGWAGFDCRTPICEQGYYVENQERFVAGTLLKDEVSNFNEFMEPRLSDQRLSYEYLTNASTAHYGVDPNDNILGLHPMWEYSNPNYTKVWEYFVNKSHRVVETRLHGNERYLAELKNNDVEQYQGGYHCSIRSFTAWEQCGEPHGNGFIFDHPNYYSRYMDTKTEDDGLVYTYWTDMEMPPVHTKTAPLEFTESFWEGDGSEAANNITYVYTNEGHRLDGIWRTFGTSRRGDSTPWAPFGTPGERIWEKGTCIVEFNRTCKKGKARDLQSGLFGVLVQDTDLSYRPRVNYDFLAESGHGRWDEDEYGECVDEVVRGCFNNGTCVAPNTCQCAPFWTGNDCSVPVCTQTCHHNGNCTLPNTCTCEKGWEGHDCTVPQCAQQCLNGGQCVAPDTCQCVQYEMEWYDRQKTPQPLFKKPNGDPMLTGYTGFDCSVPICSQHKEFILNVVGQSIDRDAHTWSNVAASQLVDGYLEFGGHGYDNELSCDSVRCPQYNELVTSNIGESFEGGCGFDPLFGQLDSFGDSTTGGCCILNDEDSYSCRACQCDAKDDENCDSTLIETSHNFTCDLYNEAIGDDDAMLDLTIINRIINTSADSCRALYPYCQIYECGADDDDASGCTNIPSTFLIEDDYDKSVKIRLCGPTDIQMTFDDEVVYRPSVIDYSPRDRRRTRTSNSFLCSLTEWEEGDYIDDGYLNGRGSFALSGLGMQYGADGAIVEYPSGRHKRRNYNNITVENGVVSYGISPEGEGIYVCENEGSCVAPDVCTCTDGWSGFYCSVPLCRHLRPYDFFGTQNVGEISSCANHGVCTDKDNCACVTTASILWTVHPEHTLRGKTGWMGTDCSTPMCSQGYYDPFCTDVEQAPGGEGCYRCANGGNCTAPDVCVCAEGWTGFDCRTPVCETVADALTRWQLNTFDEEKIHIFESDPCAAMTASGYEEIKFSSGTAEMSIAPRGECVLPNECMCFCRERYDPNKCHKRGGQSSRGTNAFVYEGFCEGAWQDDLIGSRNVLEIFEKFGGRDCYDGYEGHENNMDRFYTCHLTIIVPTQLEYISLNLIIISAFLFLMGVAAYFYIRKRIKRKYLEAKLKRRQARRAVDDEPEGDDKGKKGKK